MKVQMKPQVREAKQVDKMSVQHLYGGETIRALPGDWLITDGGVLVDVLSSAAFEEKYEPFQFAEEPQAPEPTKLPEGEDESQKLPPSIFSADIAAQIAEQAGDKIPPEPTENDYDRAAEKVKTSQEIADILTGKAPVPPAEPGE